MPIAAPSRHPSLAVGLEGGGRMYTFAGEPFYSVTTIINGGVPKYLHKHYAKMTADLVLADLERPYSRAGAIKRRWERAGRAYIAELQAAGELSSIKADKLDPLDFAARWIKGAADRHRDAAAARGSAVHQAAEDQVLELVREDGRLMLEQGGRGVLEWPDELLPWMHSFRAFLVDRAPEYLAAEASVFNRTEACAGTLDAVLRITRLYGDEPDSYREPRVLDYKSGQVYPEAAMQLAAYARGEFVGHPDGHTELAMPPVSLEGGWVLHLQPAKRRADGSWEPRYSLIPVDIGERAWTAFRYAREIYRWQTVTSRDVLGKPLRPLEAVA